MVVSFYCLKMHSDSIKEIRINFLPYFVRILEQDNPGIIIVHTDRRDQKNQWTTVINVSLKCSEDTSLGLWGQRLWRFQDKLLPSPSKLEICHCIHHINI